MKIQNLSLDHAYAITRGWVNHVAAAAAAYVEQLLTSETDTTKRLAPDGLGGAAWVAGLTVEDEGVALATSADILNFVGAGVIASGTGATKTITVAGTGVPSSGAYTVETQNPQAQRYLQQNGEFRDPLLVGTAALTVGTGATITDDTKYNSWPAACRMRNGQLIVIYYKGNGHDIDNSGNVVCKIGTEAIDGTVTWGSEITVYDHATLGANPAGVSTTSTGRVFAAIYRVNIGVANTGEAGVVYSDDFGVTWSSWIALTNTFTQEAYTAGPVVELPNGSLIVTIEGTNTGTSAVNRSSATVLSTDHGLTWGSQVSVRTYAADSRPQYESQLLLLENAGADELIVLTRTSDAAGNIYIQRSTDLGASAGGWGSPSLAFAGHGRPGSLFRWSNTIVATTRKNSDDSVIAFCSKDLGVTWDSGTAIATGMFESEYATVTELLTKDLLIIYGTQPTSSTSNADIKQYVVTEGLTSVRAGGGTSFGTPALTYSTSNSAGVATTAIRTDAQLNLFGTTPTTQAFGDSAVTGTDPKAANALHKHAMPAAAVTSSGLTESTATMLGRTTAGTGAIEEITIGSGLTLLAGSLSATATGSGQTDHEHITNVQFNGDGSTTAFELPAAPFDAYAAMAYVAGVRQDITLSGTMYTTMTFASAPASGTGNIQVDIVAAAA